MVTADSIFDWREVGAQVILEEENARLKRLVADLSLDKVMLQDVVKRKL